MKKPFQDRWFYKVIFSPLIKVLFSVLGDTMGIWGAFLILNFIFTGLWPNLKWPGIDYFIQEGKIILVSFAFLSSALYYCTRKLRINLLFILVIVHMVGTVLIYSRAIALQLKDGVEEKSKAITDWVLKGYSIYIFYASIVLYLLVLFREKWLENRDELNKQRNTQQENLQARFERNKK